MKNPALLILAILAVSSALLACSPSNDPRYVHEAAKEWKPAKAPRDESVESASLNQVNLRKADLLLADPKSDVMNGILKPYSAFILNAKFVANPSFRTERLIQMMTQFQKAFLRELIKEHQTGKSSADFKKMKEDYYNTAFAGCTRDMTAGCDSAIFFARPISHTDIFTLLAQELDPEIAKHLTAAGSPGRCIGLPETIDRKVDPSPAYPQAEQCRFLIEERYRRLNMAVYSKRTDDPVKGFSLVFMKYARLFATYVEWGRKERAKPNADLHANMASSYLAENLGLLFQTIIGQYNPKNYNDPEFKEFVTNFNPWVYSSQSDDTFRYGTNKMFSFAAKCCMYEDSARKIVSPAMTQAIVKIQQETDQFGPSFTMMIQEIKASHIGDSRKGREFEGHEYDLFKNLGLFELIQKVEDPHSGFFNEYFFIVDRLFREHISSHDAEALLSGLNTERAKTELPKMIMDYSKIYLVYMVMRTNQFMSGIYHSNTASDKIFSRAQSSSLELTDRWHDIQTNIQVLTTTMTNYFKSVNALNSEAYVEANLKLSNMNSNVHYLSAFPNMIVMNYFFTKMNGKFNAEVWGGTEEIDATTILTRFFDGQEDKTWFQFGTSNEPLDRIKVLYSLEYLLATESLNSFVAKDSSESTASSNRSRFFDVLFTKYLGEGLSSLRTTVSKFETETLGNSKMSSVTPICNYESGRSASTYALEMDFRKIGELTYTGIGDSNISQPLSAFLSGVTAPLHDLRTNLHERRMFVQVMLKVIANDLLRSHEINRETDPHPDLDRARDLLRQIDQMEWKLVSGFVTNHKRLFECALNLNEVEKRRAKRLYNEERRYLSSVFDIMRPLLKVTDLGAQNELIRRLNATNFGPSNGFRFDHIEGQGYVLTKYDLFMRMKNRIETDIFTTPDPREAMAYGPTYPKYLKPRPVHITMQPEVLEQDEMVRNPFGNAPLVIRGDTDADRADFIRQGMAFLNGQNGAFINWQKNLMEDISLTSYVSALEEIYLIGPVHDPEHPENQIALPKEDLVDAVVKVYGNMALDEMDEQNARDFGVPGRYAKSYYQGKIFDQDGQTRLPLFYDLMSEILKSANVSSVTNLTTGPVKQALDFADSFNGPQIFLFPPSSTVRDSVHDIYGQRLNGLLVRMQDLFKYLSAIEAKNPNPLALDPRLGLPFFVEGGQPVRWYDPTRSNMVDHQKSIDLDYLIRDLGTNTGHFFEVQGKAKAP